MPPGPLEGAARLEAQPPTHSSLSPPLRQTALGGAGAGGGPSLARVTT
jgi:hypothetical protein